MYDLVAFRDRIAALYRRADPYGNGRRPNQKDLADAVGLNRSELSSRLNGLKNARLTSRDVWAIVRTLAEWGAITTQAEALELLQMVDCPNFTRADWQTPPLVDLVPASELTPPPAMPNPPRVTAEPSRPTLPRPLTSFVGREHELEAVLGLAKQRRMVTLVGVGGAGKTRLALEVASGLTSQFAAGVYFVELASLSDGDEAMTAIAKSIGAEALHGELPSDAIKRTLQPRELLLVLDNCEHLAAELCLLLQQLLTACPRLHVLATSRETFRLPGEVVYQVPPLALPGQEAAITPTAIAGYDAVRLFVERAQVIQPDFQLTHQNAAAIHAICRQLDGIPLAIELAAARLRAMSVTQISSQLTNRFTLLTDRGRGVLPRHQTLRALIDWSYNLLSTTEQGLFRTLAAFNGGFTLDDVATVSGLDTLEVADGLGELLNKSLLYQIGSHEDTPRFALLETLREYAALKLAEAGDEEQQRRSHAAYYADLSEQAQAQISTAQAYWMSRLEQEHDNIRAAITWALTHEPATALRFAASLYRFWYTQGYFVEGVRYIEAALAAVAQGPAQPAKPLLLKAYSNCAGLMAEQGSYDTAADYYRRSLALSREIGDLQRVAVCLSNLGTIEMEHGNYAAAESYYQESVELRRQQGKGELLAHALQTLGIVNLYQARYAEATRLCRECLDLQNQFGDKSGVVNTLVTLAGLAMYQQDYAAAEQQFKTAMQIAQEQGNRRGYANCQHYLARLAYFKHNYAEAASLFGQSLRFWSEVGITNNNPEGLEAIAALAAVDDAQSALRLWGAAQIIRERMNTPMHLPEQHIYYPIIAQLRTAMGDAAADSAIAAGRAMNPEQAISYALQICDAYSASLVALT